jgi:cytosine/creatinine deaminase
MNDEEAFAIAVEEAKIGYKEGGVPVSNPRVIKQGQSERFSNANAASA